MGLSQEEFASYLGVNRSVLARAEKGAVLLSINALEKLGAIEMKLLTFQIKTERRDYRVCDETIQFFQKRRDKVQDNILLLKDNLERMKSIYNRLRIKLKILPIDPDNDANMVRIHFQNVRLERQFSKCDLGAQKKLESRIYVLCAELTAYEQVLQNLKSNLNKQIL